jgi:hypothetical protein
LKWLLFLFVYFFRCCFSFLSFSNQLQPHRLIPSLRSAKNRRYVVDEDLGAVAILNDFPFLDKTKPNGTSSTNILRVEGGQIRYIHEITVCSTANCGR